MDVCLMEPGRTRMSASGQGFHITVTGLHNEGTNQS